MMKMRIQPKPTGEWTVESAEKIVGNIWNRGGIIELLVDAHNAALAAERKAREIAERSAKAWEKDAHRYVTNTENCAEVIKDLNKQLAAERENSTRLACELCTARTQQQQLREQLAAERAKVKLLEGELNEAVKLLKLEDIDAAISQTRQGKP